MPFDPLTAIEVKLQDIVEDYIDDVPVVRFGDGSAEIGDAQIVVRAQKLTRLEPNDDCWKCQISASALFEVASDSDGSGAASAFADLCAIFADLDKDDFAGIDHAAVDGVIQLGEDSSEEDIQPLADQQMFHAKVVKAQVFFQRKAEEQTT